VPRILVIADGQGVHGARWVEALCELGHVVHWVATREPTTAPTADVSVLEDIGSTPLRGAWRLARNGAAVRHACSVFRPDLVQAQFLTPCGWYAWMAGRRYTVQLWGSDILKHADQPPHYRWLSARALAGAAAVTADSRNLIEVARRVAPTLREGPVLSWGVDTAIFRPADPARRAAIRQALDIDTGRIMLCTRNFGPDMNVMMLIEAFARIARAKAHDCTLVLKKGFPLDIDASPVRRAVESLGIGDRVRIIEDQYDYARMADLYAVADVFVSIPTPGKDGLAQSLLDALASGCIPVVSANRDTLEVIGDGKAIGLIVDAPLNPSAVADACADALRRRTEVETVDWNRRYVERHFERRTCLRRIDESIAEVLSC
jgi:glycosyltransferase involved in cell wall biosynthesis